MLTFRFMWHYFWYLTWMRRAKTAQLSEITARTLAESHLQDAEKMCEHGISLRSLR